MAPLFQISWISRIAHCSRVPGLNIQYCSRYPDFIRLIHCLSLLTLRGLPIFGPARLSSRTSLHLSPPTTRNANPAERAATQNFWCDDSGINGCQVMTVSHDKNDTFFGFTEICDISFPEINSGLSPWLVCEHPKQNIAKLERENTDSMLYIEDLPDSLAPVHISGISGTLGEWTSLSTTWPVSIWSLNCKCLDTVHNKIPLVPISEHV